VSGQYRKDVRPGVRVEIIMKKDQRSGRRTAGVVKDILTSAAYHSRGIKVRLEDGQIGRVQAVLQAEPAPPGIESAGAGSRSENGSEGAK
jgi:uncharacterized repeat protein (TIGR03833 family)